MEIKDISKKYQKHEVLKNIGFTVEEGKCIGILGGNGSGKSTLLSILAGVQKADGGSFLFKGEDLFSNAKKRNACVGYVPQGNALIEELTAYDNLRLWYDSAKLKNVLSEGVPAMLGVTEFVKVPVNKMSGGMKKRLSLACSVANDPQILLLDEPTAALDLVCKERIYNYLKDFKMRGGRIVLVTHDVQELELCDKWFIIREGELVPYEYDGDIHRLVGKL